MTYKPHTPTWHMGNHSREEDLVQTTQNRSWGIAASPRGYTGQQGGYQRPISGVSRPTSVGYLRSATGVSSPTGTSWGIDHQSDCESLKFVLRCCFSVILLHFLLEEGVFFTFMALTCIKPSSLQLALSSICTPDMVRWPSQ